MQFLIMNIELNVKIQIVQELENTSQLIFDVHSETDILRTKVDNLITLVYHISVILDKNFQKHKLKIICRITTKN